MRQNKGFTLIDMVVAVAVGGVVMLIFMNVISFMRMTEMKYQLKADARIGRTIGERFLWMGMKNAAPSFNTLNIPDDAGASFYDLNRDLPTLNPIPLSRRREITLSTTSIVKTFESIMVNTNIADATNNLPGTIFIDPTKLYAISSALPASIPLDWNRFKTYIDTANPQMLAATANPIFLEVFIPSSFRSLTQTTATPPNPASIFLKYAGGTFTTETFGGAYNAKHPLDPTISITSLDQFLKQLPSASGGIPPILVRPVRYVQYEIYMDPVKLSRDKEVANKVPIWHLRYNTWNGTAFANPVMIADNVRSIKFVRDDIGDPSIKINLDKVEPHLWDN